MIIAYDIDYDRDSGYYYIKGSDGSRIGQYPEYDDAAEALDMLGDLPQTEDEDPDEYIVLRPYDTSKGQYFMFEQGHITRHFSVPRNVAFYNYNFDKGSDKPKVYSSREDAEKVARAYNSISRQKNLYNYANWEVARKWW